MGFWASVLGRRPPARPDLDALFSLPQAALGLEVELGLRATGVGSVCFRAAEGPAFASTLAEVVRVLEADGTRVTSEQDGFGYTWLTDRHDPTDLPGLVTELHGVNTTLEGQGFGPGLLCSLVHFADAAGRRVALVYLYKQGTFYPFAPTGPQQRDNLLEVQVRDVVRGELPVEEELGRWMALWGAPEL